MCATEFLLMKLLNFCPQAWHAKIVDQASRCFTFEIASVTNNNNNAYVILLFPKCIFLRAKLINLLLCQTDVVSFNFLPAIELACATITSALILDCV